MFQKYSLGAITLSLRDEKEKMLALAFLVTRSNMNPEISFAIRHKSGSSLVGAVIFSKGRRRVFIRSRKYWHGSSISITAFSGVGGGPGGQ